MEPTFEQHQQQQDQDMTRDQLFFNYVLATGLVLTRTPGHQGPVRNNFYQVYDEQGKLYGQGKTPQQACDKAWTKILDTLKRW